MTLVFLWFEVKMDQLTPINCQTLGWINHNIMFSVTCQHYDDGK
jgi:hypothetical protein